MTDAYVPRRAPRSTFLPLRGLRYHVLVVSDITEQRLMALDLAHQHELLRVTLRSIGDAVITTDAAGRFRLTRAPSGDNIPLVVRLGKWRRRVVLRHPGAGNDYYERKIAEGKTRGEARRALKRHVSDRVFATLLADAQRSPGRQVGATHESSAAGQTPTANTSERSVPGLRKQATPRVA